MTSSIVKTIFINATPDTVWQYLTEKDKIGLWFNAAQSDLKPDTDYTLLDSKQEPMITGTVTVFEKPSLLIYSFTHDYLGGVITTVKWELSPCHGGTRLHLTHDGFDAVPEGAFKLLSNHDNGWDDFLTKLRKLANQDAT